MRSAHYPSAVFKTFNFKTSNEFLVWRKKEEQRLGCRLGSDSKNGKQYYYCIKKAPYCRKKKYVCPNKLIVTRSPKGINAVDVKYLDFHSHSDDMLVEDWRKSSVGNDKNTKKRKCELRFPKKRENDEFPAQKVRKHLTTSIEQVCSSTLSSASSSFSAEHSTRQEDNDSKLRVVSSSISTELSIDDDTNPKSRISSPPSSPIRSISQEDEDSISTNQNVFQYFDELAALTDHSDLGEVKDEPSTSRAVASTSITGQEDEISESLIINPSTSKIVSSDRSKRKEGTNVKECHIPFCSFKFSEFDQFEQHLKQFHLFDVQFRFLRFETRKKFLEWKETNEQRHDCWFGLGSSQNSQHFYYCYSNEGAERQLEDDLCPSYFIVGKGSDGFLEVQYLDFHSHPNGKLDGAKKPKFSRIPSLDMEDDSE